MVELLLLTVAHETETKTDKFQFQYTAANIDINNPSLISHFAIPPKDFSFDFFFSLQKVVISQPSHLVIKNIKKVHYDFNSLKKKLNGFGKVADFKIIDDPNKEQNYICFVNFVDKSDAFKCLEYVVGQQKWFANYHIERLQRDRLELLESTEESDDNEFKKVYVCLKGITDNNIKKLKQIKTHCVEVLLPPFSNSNMININKFDGFKLFTKICKILEKIKFIGNIDSFTYNHGYFLIKFAKHEQAVEFIKCMNHIELQFLNQKITLKPQKANVHKVVSTKKRPSSCDTNTFGNCHSSLADLELSTINSQNRRSSSLGSAQVFPYFEDLASPFTFPQFSFLPKLEDMAISHLSHTPNENKYVDITCFPNPVPMSYPFWTYYIPSQIPMYDYLYTPSPTKKIVEWNYPIPSSVQEPANLFIQNLPFSWTDDDLYEFVCSYFENTENMKEPDKEIISCRVIFQNNPFKCSKGYGFVSFVNPLAASKCAYYLNLYELDKSEYDQQNDGKNVSDETNNDDSRYKLKVGFAMKRGKLLHQENAKPIVLNKEFMDCLQENM